MKLGVYNNSKHTHNSYVVSLLRDDEFRRMEFFNIVGCGSTREEAINNFKKEFRKTYQDVLDALHIIENNLYEEVNVD